jgi:hypothetical protein
MCNALPVTISGISVHYKQGFLVVGHEGKKLIVRSMNKFEDNIKMNLKSTGMGERGPNSFGIRIR